MAARTRDPQKLKGPLKKGLAKKCSPNSAYLGVKLALWMYTLCWLNPQWCVPHNGNEIDFCSKVLCLAANTIDRRRYMLGGKRNKLVRGRGPGTNTTHTERKRHNACFTGKPVEWAWPSDGHIIVLGGVELELIAQGNVWGLV